MRGLPRRQTLAQGIPPLQRQDRRRPGRLRLHARDSGQALRPPARRGSRAARPDCRGRRQRTAQCRLRRPLRTGTGEPHRHHRSGQTHRRGLFPERPDALLPRPDGRTAESHHAPARRGAPFRHHVPPQQTLGRFRPYPARRDRGDRNQDSRPAAAPVPQRGPDTQGFGRGARRCGRNGESPQGLRLFPRRHPRSGQARRGRRSGSAVVEIGVDPAGFRRSDSMIYVIVEELIPESQDGQHSNLATIGVAVGFVLMMVLDITLG